MIPMMALLGQMCLECDEIHPRKQIPTTLACGECESAIFCNADCKILGLPLHRVTCRFLQAIQRDPFFMPVRDIPPTTDPAEIVIRPNVWSGRVQLAKWLIVRFCIDSPDFVGSTAAEFAEWTYMLWAYFAFAARCGVCYATKDILPYCTDCHMVFACTAHASKALDNHTDDICEGYRSMNGIHNFNIHFKRRTGREFSYVPRYPIVSPRPEEEGWPAYFQWRIPDVYKSTPPYSHPTFFEAAACKLSMSMTTLFATRQFELAKTDSSFVVHVVGLSYTEGMPDETWEEILHQLPEVKTFTVVAVKRDLTPLFREDAFEQELCESCKKKGRKCIFQAFGMLYHTFVRQPQYKKPDLVISFDVNFAIRRTTALWIPMVELLVELDVPVCFTVLSKDRIDRKEKLIEDIGAKILTRFSENPYRGKEPLANPSVMAKELFRFRNCFYLLFKGRK